MVDPKKHARGVGKRIRTVQASLNARWDASKEREHERKNYPASIAVGSANQGTLAFLADTNCRMIAEIGIWHGHTSRGIAEWLNNNGELHLFDFEDNVMTVRGQLERAGYQNIYAHQNTYKLLDSYNWSLAMLLKQHAEPVFDYVFLDGAHTWAIDALTVLLMDRLLIPGGYIDLDDYHWTLAGSPSLNPSEFPLTRKLYTEEQINTPQVRMIADLLLRRDNRYQEVVPNKIFQKIRE